MLIKKRQKYKLHRQILLVFIVSSIISILTYVLMSKGAEKLLITKYDEELVKEKQIIDSKVERIINEIKENKVTLINSRSYFLNLQKYKIQLLDIKSSVSDKFDKFDDYPTFIYVIPFEDTYGILIVHNDEMLGNFRLNEILLVSLAILLFVFLSMTGISIYLRYIQTLSNGIDTYSSGKLIYRIPEKGNNELTKLAKSLNDMSMSLHTRIEADKINEAKQRKLITNIAHDLRTPLTSIIGYLDLLFKKQYHSQSEHEEYIDIALNKSIHLQKLINDLFAYSKLTNHEMHSNIIDVSLELFLLQYLEMLDMDVDFISNNAKCKVAVDVEWFTRVLDNIFSNIEKHGVLSHKPRIRICESNKLIHIYISNMTDNDLSGKEAFLFDRMYVAEEDRSKNSSGLGLAIVREYVEQMGGQVNAFYKKGMFTIEIVFNQIY